MQNQKMLVKPFFVWSSTEKNDSDAPARINITTFIKKPTPRNSLFVAKTNW